MKINASSQILEKILKKKTKTTITTTENENTFNRWDQYNRRNNLEIQGIAITVKQILYFSLFCVSFPPGFHASCI